MSSLADYLAKNYLTADAKPAKTSKKRKRRDAQTDGLVIADDDVTGWERKKDKDLDDSRATVATGRTADFRKKKTSAWTTIGKPAPSDGDQAAADAIIRSTAAENRALADQVDDTPIMEDMDELESTKNGGLHLASQVQAQSEKKRKAEKRRIEADLATAGGPQETVYRDASGRRIDVRMKRAEARRTAMEEERKKKEEADRARGDVQIAMREARKQELDDAKYMTIARSADDVQMNDELKEVQRWNDPAAGFLTTRKIESSRVSSGSRKPTYKGSYEPNRYSISPGYRWDGVDRGNGFEKKWFAGRNKQRDRRDLEYAWQEDE